MVDITEGTENVMKALIKQEKSDFPSRAQVRTAVDNISSLADAKIFIKKLAMVVYTLRQNSVT